MEHPPFSLPRKNTALCPLGGILRNMIALILFFIFLILLDIRLFCSFPIIYHSYAVFGWYRQQQVDMVGHHVPFYYFDPFPLAQISDDLLDICFDLFVYYFPAIFGCEHDMILA